MNMKVWISMAVLSVVGAAVVGSVLVALTLLANWYFA